MRECFFLNGKKRRVADIDEATKVVSEKYPLVTRHGSVGCWGWVQDGHIVAEAWAINSPSGGWWLKVATDGGIPDS